LNECIIKFAGDAKNHETIEELKAQIISLKSSVSFLNTFRGNSLK